MSYCPFKPLKLVKGVTCTADVSVSCGQRLGKYAV